MIGIMCRIFYTVFIFQYLIDYTISTSEDACWTSNSSILNPKYEPIIFSFYPHVEPNLVDFSFAEFVYPKLSECEFDLKKQLHFSCLNNSLKVDDNQSPSSNVDDSSECGKATYTVYIEPNLAYLDGCSKKINQLSKLQCSDEIIPKIKRQEKNIYSIGYELNPMDFLRIYQIKEESKDNFHARTRITPSIKSRPALNEEITTFKRGLISQNRKLDPTNVKSPLHILEKNLEYSGDASMEKLFSEGNRLVRSQLISKDDLFYTHQQKSTFLHENTFETWQSIKDGNWKLVGDTIRQMTIDSGKDMEIFVSPIGSYKVKNISENGKESPVYDIPLIIVKIAVDIQNNTRGLVYHTFNDPLISSQAAEKFMLAGESNLCSKLSDCGVSNSSFTEAKKGLTLCCSLEHSEVWKFTVKQWRV